MTKFENHQTYQEYYEYDGNTMIVRVRKIGHRILRREWILFDTVEEAQTCFENNCGL